MKLLGKKFPPIVFALSYFKNESKKSLNKKSGIGAMFWSFETNGWNLFISPCFERTMKRINQSNRSGSGPEFPGPRIDILRLQCRSLQALYAFHVNFIHQLQAQPKKEQNVSLLYICNGGVWCRWARLKGFGISPPESIGPNDCLISATFILQMSKGCLYSENGSPLEWCCCCILPGNMMQ